MELKSDMYSFGLCTGAPLVPSWAAFLDYSPSYINLQSQSAKQCHLGVRSHVWFSRNELLLRGIFPLNNILFSGLERESQKSFERANMKAFPLMWVYFALLWRAPCLKGNILHRHKYESFPELQLDGSQTRSVSRKSSNKN